MKLSQNVYKTPILGVVQVKNIDFRNVSHETQQNSARFIVSRETWSAIISEHNKRYAIKTYLVLSYRLAQEWELSRPNEPIPLVNCPDNRTRLNEGIDCFAWNPIENGENQEDENQRFQEPEQSAQQAVNDWEDLNLFDQLRSDLSE